MIQIILVEPFQKLFKLDGTLIGTAVSNSTGIFFNTLCKPSSATAHCLYYTALHCYTAYTAHIAYAAFTLLTLPTLRTPLNTVYNIAKMPTYILLYG